MTGDRNYVDRLPLAAVGGAAMSTAIPRCGTGYRLVVSAAVGTGFGAAGLTAGLRRRGRERQAFAEHLRRRSYRLGECPANADTAAPHAFLYGVKSGSVGGRPLTARRRS